MIVQNREKILLFFIYISSPYQSISMLHKGSRNGVYAFQRTKTHLENFYISNPCNSLKQCYKGWQNDETMSL